MKKLGLVLTIVVVLSGITIQSVFSACAQLQICAVAWEACCDRGQFCRTAGTCARLYCDSPDDAACDAGASVAPENPQGIETPFGFLSPGESGLSEGCEGLTACMSTCRSDYLQCIRFDCAQFEGTDAHDGCLGVCLFDWRVCNEGCFSQCSF